MVGQPRLNLKRLWYFKTLADELHFHRAAERLNMTQPGLSQQISVLEKELGIRLLERGSNGVSLTEAGRALKDGADDLLAGADRLDQRMAALATGLEGALRVAYTRSAGDVGISDLVFNFRNEHPNLRLETSTGWTGRNLELLDQGEVDVAFVRLPLDERRPSVTVTEEELLVALPSGHPLASASSICSEDLRREPIVFWPRHQGPGFYDRVIEAIWGSSSPKIVMEESEAEQILEAVSRGVGCSVLDARRAMKLCPPAVTLKPLRKALKIGVGLTWATDDDRPVVKEFVEACRAHA